MSIQCEGKSAANRCRMICRSKGPDPLPLVPDCEGPGHTPFEVLIRLRQNYDAAPPYCCLRKTYTVHIFPQFVMVCLSLHRSFFDTITGQTMSDQRWCGRPHLLLERYGEPHLLRMVVWTLWMTGQVAQQKGSIKRIRTHSNAPNLPILTHIYLHLPLCIYIYIHIHTHTHIYIYINIYIYIHIYIYI